MRGGWGRRDYGGASAGVQLTMASLRTAADLSSEPNDGLRREVHDGVVLAFPPTSDEHSWKALAADRALSATAPDDVYILQNVGVHVGLRRLYVPDLVVVYRDTAFHDHGYDPGGVLLAVEIVSPSSVTLDRINKPAVYVEQSIPFYWRIEADPRLLCHHIAPATGSYVLDRELAPGEKAELTEPWPLTIDMTEFVMPHKNRSHAAWRGRSVASRSLNPDCQYSSGFTRVLDGTLGIRRACRRVLHIILVPHR